VIGTAGRLVPSKFPDRVLERCANLPSVVLLVVGDGPERERLGELARRWQMSERVVFTGDCLDMGAMYSAMDVFVSASMHETFGLAVLEALANGLPRCTCTTPVWTSWPTDPYRGVPGRSWGRVAACGDRPAEGRAAPSARRGAGAYDIRRTAAEIDSLTSRCTTSAPAGPAPRSHGRSGMSIPTRQREAAEGPAPRGTDEPPGCTSARLSAVDGGVAATYTTPASTIARGWRVTSPARPGPCRAIWWRQACGGGRAPPLSPAGHAGRDARATAGSSTG